MLSGQFKLQAHFTPAGDQPAAIQTLVRGVQRGDAAQTLLGVTGSGKTFTVANVIQAVQRPTLVIAHNKTLAAQLCNEFREFFPHNAVHYFVSYYDYYQPEAYLATSDTYIEKEAMINEEIDRLRHAATQSLLTRRDVIIVASVSCIYGLGSPANYQRETLRLAVGEKFKRAEILQQLVARQFRRTTGELRRGTFRLRGELLDVVPVESDQLYRLDGTGGRVQEIAVFDLLTKKKLARPKECWLFPTKHYVADAAEVARALTNIRAELTARLAVLEKEKNELAAERLRRRTRYDLTMIKEVGYVNGIENYSRHFDGRAPGEPPYTLLDYFPRDFLTVIDESHVTVPQINAMAGGDAARKKSLIAHGFRLPSAADNRPLTFTEFVARTGQTIYTSATPAEYERQRSAQIVEQIIRPTGLVDPELILRPVVAKGRYPGQIKDLLLRIAGKVKSGERIMITTLTKKMAEELADYLQTQKIKVSYLHSDVPTVERIKILTDFRLGKYDVLVGVNLLREGLDVPETGLVAILDADKEGFLRSDTALIQTIGRAARNAAGQVVLYADQVTGSLERAIHETERRRSKQLAYNKDHGITPQTIKKTVRNILQDFGLTDRATRPPAAALLDLQLENGRPISAVIAVKEKEMQAAAKELQFELAALLRDEIVALKKLSKNPERAKLKL